ncbi:MAG: carboxypeptidase regulatory-like domain-containing protein [Candidatus Levyibacteriota bacterium]
MRLKLQLLSGFFLVSLFLLVSIKPVFADTVTLSGSVKNSTGNAISGATVKVNDANNDQTTTDSSGSYTMLIPGGTYNVQVIPPSGSTFSPSIALSQNIISNTVLNFVLTPSGTVTLSGHLYDSQGSAVTGATVALLQPATGTVITSTTTDNSGHYSVTTSSGNYGIRIDGTNTTSHLPPGFEIGTGLYSADTAYSLTQSIVLDFTIPAKKVSIHVQDSAGNSITNVQLGTNINHVTNGLTFNSSITDGSGSDGYGSNLPVTDSSGNATLWLLPMNYTFTATPPSGSVYNLFTLNNIVVTSDQTELISLQYNHATPVTSGNLTTLLSDGNYSNPTTVTFSASAASGYRVANVYYTVDGGSQQTYSTPFTVTGNGSHTITYWSVDNSGVQETHNTKTFTITESYDLTGTVYSDTNQNGVQDIGEAGYRRSRI